MPTDRVDTIRLGRALVGRRVRFLSQGEDATPCRVLTVALDGMVEIEGYSGLFAPDLFRIIDEAPDPPEECP